MIDGLVTIVVYGLIISTLFGLFMFAVADLPLAEHHKRIIWIGALAILGLFGWVLLFDLIGITDFGMPRIQL